MNKPELARREQVLELLTDEETALVSRSEPSAVNEGDEYVDLDRLDAGVQRVDGVPLAKVSAIFRRLVHDDTWRRIISVLAANGTERPWVS